MVPHTPNLSKAKEKNNLTHTEQKKYYDIGAKTLKPLQNDDTFRIKNQNKSWQPVVIVNKQGERSYTVRIGDGAQYKSNHRHLLKTNESMCQKSMFVTHFLIFWIITTPI